MRISDWSSDVCSSDLPDLAAQQANYMRMLNIAMARGAPAPDGHRATATDWFDLLDRQAQNQLAWEAVFARYDFVLAPPAPARDVPHSEIGQGQRRASVCQVGLITGVACVLKKK